MNEPRYVTLLRAFVKKWNESAADPENFGGTFEVDELAEIADAFEEHEGRGKPKEPLP